MTRNLFNPDFKDFLQALNQHDVDYMIVGGYAVIMHGYTRTTGDLDIWVRKNVANYEKLVQAFTTFGMPTFDMSKINFLENEALDVFTFGVPPICIELITNIKGVTFEDAYENAIIREIDDISIKTLSLADLLKAKRAAGRPKDQDDIEHLQP
jgi:predicted nucleotidyltransferase